jgi:hypothetical protein
MSARIRAGSRFKWFPSFVLIEERCLRVPPGGTRSPKLKSTVPNNLLTDGSEVVSLICGPPFTLKKLRCTHFCSRFTRSPGHRAAGQQKIETQQNILWHPRPVQSKQLSHYIPCKVHIQLMEIFSDLMGNISFTDDCNLTS